VSQLSSSWADNQKVFALGIRNDAGEIVQPTPAEIASHRYPMSRPLFLLTNGEPQGNAKTFVDFMLSARGQELVKKHGYLALDQLNKTVAGE
jgi:phosphate transport system substrate-binding protein